MDSPDDWTPVSPDPDTTQLKWGFNAETGEVTIWEVAGPGDGFPSHHAYLTTAWGREPRHAKGDIVGIAEWRPPTLVIRSYQADLPEAVESHFREAYPGAEVIVS